MSIGASEFQFLREMMQTHAAIILDPGKEYLAELRLSGLVTEAGCSSVQELLQSLRRNSFSPLHHKVLDAMTNNETWFFRDFAPYEALRKVLLPNMLVKRATERKVRIWSAACSSGQEPYSIAMLVKENFPLPGWQFSIHATDISGAVLRRAQAGRYSQLEVNRGLPASLLSKYFERAGLDWHLKQAIRDMVSFAQMNLAEPWPSMPPFDIVFLRNVLIYFDLDCRREILARLRRLLRPDGCLVLGGAETTFNLDDNFERVAFENTSYYRVRATKG